MTLHGKVEIYRDTGVSKNVSFSLYIINFNPDFFNYYFFLSNYNSFKVKEIAKMLFLASRQANNKLAIKLLKQVSKSLIIKIVNNFVEVSKQLFT